MEVFEKPIFEIVRLNNGVIATSYCSCYVEGMPVEETDKTCSNPVPGGDYACCQAQYGGNC